MTKGPFYAFLQRWLRYQLNFHIFKLLAKLLTQNNISARSLAKGYKNALIYTQMK